MAVGEIKTPSMPAIAGVRLSSVASGIRYSGREDLVLIELSEGTSVAGCFTRNLYKAAPVLVCQEHLAKTSSRYLLINSGNANACTGEPGLRDAKLSCQWVANLAGMTPESVLPFSTGVIGQPMKMTALEKGIPNAFAKLDALNWEPVAKAIMTTDTFPKMVTRDVEIDEGIRIKISGIAKGAGMIRPDMATMLAYVFTDAKVDAAQLQKICSQATDKSFNRVTVDGDTSTNDSVILAATGKVDMPEIGAQESSSSRIFAKAVIDVFQELAQLLVRDGEGATKFVTITVGGGKGTNDCLKVAYSIAHSPLVKTALFASDPNWGRLVAAIGRSGVEALDVSKVRVWLDDLLIVENAGVAEGYREELGQQIFDQAEFCIRIDLGMGSTTESIWTCDLSHEYVSINADYRS
jgi:glutamate N-acetyltransferase/amino-acid N-acetyltransferase